MKYLFSLVAAVALLLGISSTMRAQTEVTLLAPNPFRGSLDKVAPGFQSKTGYKLKLTYGKGLGTRRQVARGEMFDVSILLPPYPEALASGNIDPKSATTLGEPHPRARSEKRVRLSPTSPRPKRSGKRFLRPRPSLLWTRLREATEWRLEMRSRSWASST